MGNISFALTKPQLEHAQWGSLALPHLGHAVSTAALRARCERRLRLQHLEVFFTGNMPKLLRLRLTKRPFRVPTVFDSVYTPSAGSQTQLGY